MTRGSDVTMHPPRKSSVVTSESGELKFEEAQELSEGEVKEVIIYLPPSKDDFDSEVARSDKCPQYTPHDILDQTHSQGSDGHSDPDWCACCTGSGYSFLDHMPPVVSQDMRSTFHDPGGPGELSYRTEKWLLPVEGLLRAPTKMEPSVGSYSNAPIAKSFFSWHQRFSSVDLFSVYVNSASPEQSKHLTIDQTNEMISVKFRLNETTTPVIKAHVNSILNPHDKTYFKFNGIKYNNIKYKRSNVESENSLKSKNDLENRSSNDVVSISLEDNFDKHSEFELNIKEKRVCLNGLINKKRTFGCLLLLSVTFLGYYNFVWIH